LTSNNLYNVDDFSIIQLLVCRINSHCSKCWFVTSCTTKENKRHVNWQSFCRKE